MPDSSTHNTAWDGGDFRDLLVGACGLATSLLTALILWLVESESGFAFYSLMLWFVVPVGALLSGFAGASGYYAGARMFSRRPTKLLLLNVALVSVGTFVAIQYLSYITLDIEGTPASDYVSFAQYVDISTRATSMKFKAGATGELGALGYGIAILQVIGFAAGGIAVYLFLRALPYCNRCSRYLSAKGKQTRHTGDAEAMQVSVDQILQDLGEGAVASALERHRTFGDAKLQKDQHLRSTFAVRYCKQCSQHWVNYTVENQSGNDWKEIDALTKGGFTDQVVHVRASTAARVTRGANQ